MNPSEIINLVVNKKARFSEDALSRADKINGGFTRREMFAVMLKQNDSVLIEGYDVIAYIPERLEVCYQLLISASPEELPARMEIIRLSQDPPAVKYLQPLYNMILAGWDPKTLSAIHRLSSNK